MNYNSLLGWSSAVKINNASLNDLAFYHKNCLVAAKGENYQNGFKNKITYAMLSKFSVT